jgi:2-oxoisovalerate dehydrogenase E1 component
VHSASGGARDTVSSCSRQEYVAVAFFGDGAVNNGAFHEGLNMAAIWKLPVLFVCENNQYATEVPFAEAAGNPGVANRAAAYGLPGIAVDGNDVLAVHEAAREALRRARGGAGPTLIECKTYRTRPHSEGMGDFTYRTREEVEEWKARCPIARLREKLLADKVASEDELDWIDDEVAGLAERAHEIAETSALPDPATAATHVFAGEKSQDPPTDFSSPSLPRREVSFMKATLEALTTALAANPRIFVLGEGIGKRGGNFNTTSGLFALHGPERLRDTPICERGFVGLACGAAMTGTRPVVDFMFADFVLDGLGEIFNQIAKDPIHEQRTAHDAGAAARMRRHRPRSGDASLGQLLLDLRAHSRPARRRALDAVRCEGPARDGAHMQRPGPFPGAS